MIYLYILPYHRSRAEVLPANSDPPANRSSQETSTSSIAEDRRQVDVSPAKSSHPVLNDKWAVEQLNREKEDLLDKVQSLLDCYFVIVFFIITSTVGGSSGEPAGVHGAIV